MMYWALGMIGVLAAAVYLLLVYRAVPGAAAERLGELAPLPADLGQWKVDSDSTQAIAAKERGEVREERTWFYPNAGLFGPGKLVRQVRYRRIDDQQIVRSEPEQKLTRRRIKA